MLEFHIDDETFQDMIQKFPGAMERATETTAIELWGNIKREAPVDQGRLQGSYELHNMGNTSWGIHSDVEYRWAVHDGTPPRVITPTTAKALHFYWQKAGGYITVKSVNHPGTPANPYIDRAIDITSGRVPEFAVMAIQEVFE